MQLAHEKGTPPMPARSFLNFPTDAGCAAIDDEFLFGPDILVAPVLEYGARKRKVFTCQRNNVDRHLDGQENQRRTMDRS